MLHLESLLLVVFAIATVQAVTSSKFYDSLLPGPSSPCLPGTPCLPGQEYRSLKPLNRRPVRPSRLSRISSRKSFAVDSCIDKFVCTFMDAVQSCSELSDLFNFFSGVSSLEFCNAKYPEILDALNDMGEPNPEFASQRAVEAIADCADVLTADIVIQVYSRSIAKYLFTEGILTQQNSVQLAKQYADVMEEAIKCNDSQYTALKEGYVNFLYSLNAISPDRALLIALVYGNEWKMVSKPRQGSFQSMRSCNRYSL